MAVIAIPGQPTRYAEVPQGAVGMALWALSPIQARWDSHMQTLRVPVPASMTKTGNSRLVIDWRWGEIWRSDDWYEMGWHPNDTYHALNSVGRRTLQDALNPGKWRGDTICRETEKLSVGLPRKQHRLLVHRRSWPWPSWHRNTLNK